LEGRLGDLDLDELERLPERMGRLLPQPPDAPEPPEAPEAPAFRWKRDREPEVRAFREVFRGFGRGRLGIRYHELSDQLARYYKVEGGVLVSSVAEGSPAEKAGIKAGDVIVKVNGKAVKDAGDLHSEVARVESGAEATLSVQRDGKALDVKVKLEERERTRRLRRPTT